ncbi:MAG: hypothetical protein JXR31_15405, partial [Prolixibacteraceae bacterium]|nr:hypothetical protein [Prolixibacteraceae bacterium]MBN2775640.1 hypothetical protein [Prolixibacteraceae bacterium]
MVKKQNQSYAVRKKRRKKRKAAGKKTNFKKYRLIVSGIVLISFAITMYFPLSRKYKELTHPKDIGTVR